MSYRIGTLKALQEKVEMLRNDSQRLLDISNGKETRAYEILQDKLIEAQDILHTTANRYQDELFNLWEKETEVENRLIITREASEINHYGGSDDWIQKYSKTTPNRENESMANKFLPFVVEKSTPVHIFETLISRSKGMNNNLVTSIFYLVLSKGIKEVREIVAGLPDMHLEKIYENLVNNNPKYRISGDLLQEFRNLSNFISPREIALIDKRLQEFEIKDALSCILVMCLLGRREEVTEIPFELIIEEKKNLLENIKDYFLIDESGEEIYLVDADHLETFMVFYAFIDPTKYVQTKIYFRFKNKNSSSNDDDIPF